MRNLIAAAALCLAPPAFAQAPPNTSAGHGVHVTIVEPDDSGKVGEIVHHNRFTMPVHGPQFLEFETERGVVIVRLDTTNNRACVGPNPHGCPDTLTVWELPEGIMASAMEIETPELETSVIDLFEWTGM